MADAQPSFFPFTVAAGMLATRVRECIVAIEQGDPMGFWKAYRELLQSREEYRADHPGKLNLLRALAGRADPITWQEIPAGLYHEVPLVLAHEAFLRMGDPSPWKMASAPATVGEFLGCDIPSTALTALVELIENEHVEYFYVAGNNAGQGADENREAKHSTDYHSVLWYGTEYKFTNTQAACVKVLWEAWEQGTPDVGQAAILEEVDSDRRRLSDVFGRGKKRHPAWGTMIQPGATKGTFRLAEPEI